MTTDNDFLFSRFVRSDPQTAAMLSKAVPNDRTVTVRDNQGNRQTAIPDLSIYKRKSARRGKQNADAATVLKILPDLDMGLRILVSSILAPADMVTTEVGYKPPRDIVTSELASTLIQEITTHFEQEYKVKTLLPEILRDILGEKGSYPIAVIPENAIDAFINGSISIASESDLSPYVTPEGLPRNTGILGSGTDSNKEKVRGLSLEAFRTTKKADEIDPHIQVKEADGSYGREEYVTVTDNLMVLKFPMVHEHLKHASISRAMISKTNSFSLEAEIDEIRRQQHPAKISNTGKVSDLKIEQNLYPNRQFQYEITSRLQGQAELTRRSIGMPLCMKFPSESILPVHVPGNPKKHIGYFALLDNEGNPIAMSTEDAYNDSLGRGIGPGMDNTLGNSIMRKINANLGDHSSFDVRNGLHMDMATHVYADIVERDLLARIKNGVHSTSAQIATNDEFYRVMLSRTLQKKYTQVLYIPLEYMTYMAFSYDDHGIGRSLLDETSTVNTLRSVLQFNDVIAAVRNSIGRTHVEMTLPEDDPDPLKTIERAQHDIVRSRQLDLPLSITNPSDITEFLSRAGYDWNFSGHPDLPQLKVDFSQTNTQYTKADPDLSESLKKLSIMGLSLSPQTIDNGFAGDLATTVTANNILLGKRVLQYQQDFTPQLGAHLKKYLMHHRAMFEKLQQLVKDNIHNVKYAFTPEEKAYIGRLGEERGKFYLINRVLKEFIDGIEVTLPEPPTVTMEGQKANYDTWKEAMTEAIDAYISSEILNDGVAGSEMSGRVDAIKAMILSHFSRQWMAEHNFLPELGALVAETEDGRPQVILMEEMTRHLEAMVRSCMRVVAKTKPISQAADLDMQNLNNAGQDDMGGGEGETGPDELGAPEADQ
jgi:hypothetical protein